MLANSYRNLSVRGKLFTGFGVLMLMQLALWFTAERGLSSLYTGALELSQERYVKADMANELMRLELIASQSYRDVAAFNTPAEDAEDFKIMRENRERIDVVLRSFDSHSLDNKEKELLAIVKLRKSQLDAEYEKYFKLVGQEHKEENKPTLFRFINESMSPVDDTFVHALVEFAAYQNSQTLASTSLLQDGYGEVQKMLGSVGIVAIVTGIGLSLLLSQGIASALTRAIAILQGVVGSWEEKAEIAAAISAGDLDREVRMTPLLELNLERVGEDEPGRLLKIVHTLTLGQQKFESALIGMTGSFRAKRTEEAQRDWFKTGETELNNLLRGERPVAVLTDEALRFLAEYLKAGVGAFYVVDDSGAALHLSATYAFTRRKQLGERLEFGQGLVGQVARERKPICWTEVPADYISIGSALGEAPPRHAIAVPVLQGQTLLGVIELASFREIRDLDMSLLLTACESLAISLAVATSRQRIDALLEETRQQTERLQVQQEELKQSNESLEERARLLEAQRQEVLAKNMEVERANVEMQRKSQELARVSAYKSEFLANMSHELRTPLNSIMILSRLLMQGDGKFLSDKQREQASTIHSAGADLLGLINDILDLSKVEAGQMHLYLEPVAIEDVCAHLESIFLPQAQAKGLDFAIHVAPGVPPTFVTDEQRCQQVLKNLLSNAVKFTTHGAVQLQLGVVAAPSPEERPLLSFTVRDSGIGIASEQLAIIFEAFHQADGSANRKFGGTGLGLSIARKLARLLGGDVTAQSALGQGSVFTLLLPLDQRPEAANEAVPLPPERVAPVDMPIAPAPMPDDREHLGPHKRSILIIEDDITFAAQLLQQVRSGGFLGVVAADGRSGLQLAKELRPSAILLDIMLPDIDGWTVMRQLKQEDSLRDIPVHVLTALDSRAEAKALGAVGLSHKPVAPEELQGLLKRLEAAAAEPMHRLLLVEDEPGSVEQMRELLDERGRTIVVARSVADAQQLLQTQHFDAMVLDLLLQDGSGLEVLEFREGLPETRQPPVIVHTAKQLGRDEYRQLERYAKAIIVKGPRSMERLLEEVGGFLRELPAYPPAPMPRAPDLARPFDPDPLLEGRKVLVADDDLRNVYSLSSLLATQGMLMVDAENGEEALRRLAEHQDIDLVLMDIMMPVMDGFAAIKAIRSQPAYRDLPIIAMTAKAMHGDREQCLAAGASDYISKPVEVDKLLHVMSAWLGKSNMAA